MTLKKFNGSTTMCKQTSLTILAVVTAGVLLAAAALIYAYSTTDIVAGGSGAGWSCSKAAWTIKLVRAGKPISIISRTGSTVSVTLTGGYPNTNLKVGQKIVVSGVTGADAAVFNGTFVVATVPDQVHFTYASPTSGSATGTVDGSSIAGGDYTSLVAWEAAEGGDLISASNTAVAECYNDWADGLVEDLILMGNTTDAEHYMKITAPASERNNGTTGTGFRLVGNFTLADNEKVTATYIEVTGLTTITAGTLTTAGSLFTGGLSVAPGATIINTLTDYLPQYFGGAGAGWAYAEIPDSPLGDVLAETVKLIRAERVISVISRTGSTVSVTLSSNTSGNLKVGQSIKISGVTGTGAPLNGTFSIVTVSDQTHFTYATSTTGTISDATIDGSSIAGGDYATLSAWHTAVAGNFISPTPRIETAECYNDWGSSGLSDNLTITGNTTDANRYIKIKVPLGERHTGTTGTGFKLAGTLTVSDSEYVKVEYVEASGLTIVSAGNFTDLGSLYKGGLSVASGATVNLGGSAFTNWGTVTLDAASTVVYIGPVDNSRSAVTLINAAHGNIALNNSFCTFNLPANFTVNGNLFIGSANTLDARNILGTSSYNMTVAGNWTNNGTFTYSTGTVTLSGADQTINGSSTFYKLTKDVSADAARTLTVTAGTTQTIATGGTLTLKGASGKVLTLQGSSAAAWYLNVNTSTTTTYVVDYVNAAYSNAAGGKTLLVTNSTDSLNNVNWDFGTYDKTWTGTTSTAWATATNWSEGAAPISTDKVRIPVTTNMPIIDVTAGAITIAKLSIENGATLTMSNGNTTTDKKLIVTGDVRIYSGGNITHTENSSAETHKVNLFVGGNLTIDSGGTINVDSMGYHLGTGPGSTAVAADGAGHGGTGGDGEARSTTVGTTYDSITAPVNLGCGGGYLATHGGGAVKLTVAGAFTNNGTISAGCVYVTVNSAGGSGGSIYITTGTISGAGTIRANGGSISTAYGGGGGGRVAIILTGSNADFGNFGAATVTAYGGDAPGAASNGAAGTVYTETAAQHAAPGSGVLTIDNNNLSTESYVTTLMRETNPSGTVVGTDLTKFSQVIVKGKGNLGLDSDDTFNFANLSCPTSGAANAYVTIFPNSTAAGSPNENRYYAPLGVTLGSGVTIANYTLVLGTPTGHFLDGVMGFTGPLTVSSTGNITHMKNGGGSEVYKLNLFITGDFTINPSGTINVDGLGYGGASGPGQSWADNGTACASHGGIGNATTLQPVYGSITAPVRLGSGGNGNGGSAYSGGGAVELTVTGAFTHNGTISSIGSTSCSASGGSIYVTTGTISGAGTIRANGGPSGGAGGRVAVILTGSGADFGSFGSATVTAYGLGSSAAGTVYKQTEAQGAGKGDLIIDNNNVSTSTGVDTRISSLVTNTTVGRVILTDNKAGKLNIDPGQTLTIQGAGTTLNIGIGAAFTNNGTLNLGGTTFTKSGTMTAGQRFSGSAISSDGTKLIVGVRPGRIFTSSDSGVAWTERQPAGAVNKHWQAIASSSDGMKLLVGGMGEVTGRLYTGVSADAGVTYTWTERQPAGAVDKGWYAASSSADGTKLIAAVTAGRIYTGASADAGVTYTWTERQPAGAVDKYWCSTASSSDGTKLVAGNNLRLYYTTNTGANWIELTPAGAVDKSWNAVASSADGLNLIVGANSGRLYTGVGTSGGTSWAWTERNPLAPTAAADKGWQAVASSSDGTKLVAAVSGGRLYTSADSGATWTERNPLAPTAAANKSWFTTASSSDGTKLVAGVWGGDLYVSTDSGATWKVCPVSGTTINYTGQSDNSAVTLLDTMHNNITLNKSDTTFSLPAAGLTVNGNWNTTAGTFNPGTYTVTLSGAKQKLLGSTSFYSLNKTTVAADTLYFDNTGTQTFASGGTLTLAGASGALLSLRSCNATGAEVAGTYAHINPSGTRAVSYVDVKDNYNDNAIVIEPTNSTSSGHNVNWSTGTFTWLGGTSTAWELPANWAGGVVPGPDSAVSIPNTTTYQPTLNASTAIGSLTINKAGMTLTCATGADLTVSNDVIVSAGTLDLTNNTTLTCGGNINLTGGTLTGALTGKYYTIVMNAASGTKTFTPSAAKVCYKLTLRGGATYNFWTADIAIGVNGITAGRLTVENGATLNAPTGTLTLYAVLDTSSGGTFNHNNGTVSFGGAYPQIDANTTLTLNNFTINLWADTYYSTIAAGDTLVVNGTLRLQNGKFDAGGTIDAKGPIVVDNTFDGGTGTILIDGPSSQSFTIPGLSQYQDTCLPAITLNQAATTIDFAAGANVTFHGAIIIQAGTFTSTSGRLTLSRTSSGTALDTTGGTFNHNNGTVRFSTYSPADNVYVYFNSPLEMYNVMMNPSNRTLTIPAGKTIVANGTLTLEDGAINTGNITAKGNVNVQKGLPDGGNGTITLSGTSDQLLTFYPYTYDLNNLNIIIPPLIIDKDSGTVTATGSVMLYCNITLTKGTLSFAPGYTYAFYPSPPRTISVASGATLNFVGTSPTNLVTLTSSVNWNLTNTGTVNADFVKVDHSQASATVNTTNSIDNGSNNANWVFPAASLSSYDLNMTTKKLILTFANGVLASTVNSAITSGSFTLQNSASSPTESYTLTNSSTASLSGPVIVINISVTDFNAIAEMTALCKQADRSDSYLSMATGVTDIAGVAVAAVSGMQAATYTIQTDQTAKFRVTTAGGAYSMSATAGEILENITLTAYDASGYRSSTYVGDKTVTFSGANASPDPVTQPKAKNKVGSYVNFSGDTVLTFANGKATTAAVVLYNREEPARLCASVTSSIDTDALYDLEVTVGPELQSKLAFTQQPSTTGKINVALTQQPIVEIRDLYGNRTNDINTVTLYDSTTKPSYVKGPGTIANAMVDAENGTATFSGVTYDKISTIYMQARVAGITSAWSDSSVVFSTMANDTVDVVVLGDRIANFNLIPTKDDLANKFAVLRFKVTDAGGDLTDTFIDQLQIAVGGTGANASTDIAWAGISKNRGTSFISTPVVIANGSITFGSAPDSNSTAAFDTVADGTSTEYTVYIYMKNSKMTATDGKTYTFGVNESLIGVDQGLSSQMTTPANANVATVTGTITIVVTHLEMVTTAGATSASAVSGAPLELMVRAVDRNRNIDINYGPAPDGVTYTLKFYGLSSSPNNTSPKIEEYDFGNNTAVNFISGVSDTGTVTLTAYNAETASIEARQYSGQTNLYTSYPISVTVASAEVGVITATSGSGQVGKTSKALPTVLMATVKDNYGNLKPGAAVTFTPSGNANISPASTTTNSLGQATTTLTLGTAEGAYTVSAATGALAPAEFTATGRIPRGIYIAPALEGQSAIINNTLASAYVVKLVDTTIGNGNPIPNETITFNFQSIPSGADTQSLTATSGTTNSSGQVTTLLTLGQIVGDYVVRATYTGVSPNVTKDITATGLSAGATKIVLSGPSSITAGSPSAAFTITSKDIYNNVIALPTATNFDLTTDYAYNVSTRPGGGRFYSDSACTAQITQATIGVDSSSATFYYKQTGATSIAVTATKATGGHPLPDGSSSTISSITILPAGLGHFKVTAGDVTPIIAGVARSITVTAYDIHGNPATNLGTANVKFKFIDEAAHLSGGGTAPTCGGAVFGSSASLVFSGVNATATASLVLYKPETSATAIIKAYTDSGADTSNDDDLAFTVRHSTADHVAFTTNLPSPVSAGTAIDFGDAKLNVIDPYGNICNGDNGAAAYAGSKTIAWTLSGASDAPDGLHADTFTNPVSFTAGSSTTALSATLYRAQKTTITANIAALPKTVANSASNEITVNSGVINKLVFDTATPLTCITTQALDPQPRVAVGDAFGNPCSSAIANITLAAVTDESGTLAVNGTLGGTTTRAISSGVAQFTGITYDYPEAIYLQASVSGVSLAPAYSTQIQFGTTTDLSASALTSQEKTAKSITGSISSMANNTAVPVYGFKVADDGSDGRDGFITKMTIRASAGDTTGDWTNYIADAWLTDTSVVGATPRLCTVAARSITCGDGVNTIFTVPNGNTASPKIYALSVTLKKPLPTGADGKTLGFTITSNTDLKVNTTLGSTFPSATIIADSSMVAVTATDLKITGSANAIAAGGSITLAIKAIDANNNIDKDYSGEKSIRFTGANLSPNETAPTCTDNIGSARNFTVGTLITFTSGASDPAVTDQLVVRLYNAEVAVISVSDTAISSSFTSRLSVTVSGGSASQLFWKTQPVSKVVANAPWKPFVLSVSDAYGNTSSSTADITVTASGTGVHAGDTAVATVAASAGLATFNDFSVWCDSYPGAATLNATAEGVTASGPSDSVQVDQVYSIVFTVKDTVTATQLSGVSFKVQQTVGSETTTVYGPVIGNSPFLLTLPYGKYTFMMSLDKYLDYSAEDTVGVSADGGDGVYDNVINWTRYMTTLTEATADYRVIPSFVYDEDNDDLYIRLWLERRGKLILNSSVNILGQAVVDVYDDATQAWLNPIMLTPPSPIDTTNGTYMYKISDIAGSASNGLGKKLVSGKTYFAKCLIYYGGLLGDGTLYEAGATFTITNTQKVGNEIISKLGVPEGQTLGGMVADVQTNIAAVSTKVDTTSTAIIAKVDTVSANVSSVGTKVDTVQASAGAILDSVNTTLPAKIDAELAKGVLSEMLTRYTILREDDSVKIRYRTATGLAPKLTIYKPDGTILSDYNGVTMKEISNTGIYEYEVTAKESWGVGDFTAEASEGVKKSKDSMVLTIKALYTPGAGVEESIDAVGEAVSKVYTRQKSVEGLLGGATDVKSSTTIFGKVNGLNSTIDSLNLTTVATDAKNARMNAQNIYNEMENLKKAAGDAQAQASSFKELSRQLSEMQANLRKASQNLGAVSAISGGGTTGTTTIIGGSDIGAGTGGAGLSANAERDLGAIKRDMAALKKGAGAPTLKEEDVKGLNNRVEELTALVKLLSKTMETTNNKPVVEGWFEQG